MQSTQDQSGVTVAEDLTVPGPASLTGDGAALRHAFVRQMRCVPGAVAIVAAAVGDERSGLAATAWNSLSADPPMLLACINRSASAHPLALRAGAFSINLLAARQTEAVAIFSAQRGLEGRDRFGPNDWRDGPMGQPMLQDAVATFECVLEAAYDHGSHTILVGRVGAMISSDDEEALLYVDGCFAAAARMPT